MVKFIIFFFNKKINNFNIFFHIPVLDLQVFNSENAETNINCLGMAGLEGYIGP